MSASPPAILVTGANGQLARRLFATLEHYGYSPGQARAVVRSERAAASVRELPETIRPEIHIVDYADVAGLARAMEGCTRVLHLVGILKESKRSRYVDAHEHASAALAKAAAQVGVERIVYLSIIGSTPEASNACLASKGRAERLLLDHQVAATILRLPMVLGSDDFASRALRREATAGVVPMIGGGKSLEQPIDVDDVVRASLNAFTKPDLASAALDLAGPESLAHRALIERAAKLYGNTPRVIPIPTGLARLGVRIAERILPEPPITSTMLEVLLHDDCIDPKPACQRLELELTSLDEMLRLRVGPGTE